MSLSALRIRCCCAENQPWAAYKGSSPPATRPLYKGRCHAHPTNHLSVNSTMLLVTTHRGRGCGRSSQLHSATHKHRGSGRPRPCESLPPQQTRGCLTDPFCCHNAQTSNVMRSCSKSSQQSCSHDPVTQSKKQPKQGCYRGRNHTRAIECTAEVNANCTALSPYLHAQRPRDVPLPHCQR